MALKEKQIRIEYNVQREYLDLRGLTEADIKKAFDFLASIFGFNYEKIFHKELYREQDIDVLILCRDILSKIQDCTGFKRFIKQYDNHNHLFTARVAGFLLDKGFQIELEPDMSSKSGPHPDLKLKRDDIEYFAECKTSDISNFFKHGEKRAIADVIYEKVKTCDQLTLYLKEGVTLKLVQELFDDKDVIQSIYRTYEPGKDGKETILDLHELVRVNVMQKPAIVGGPEEFLQAELQMHLVNIESDNRMIGFSFMEKGRAVVVVSNVNYDLKWKDKKEQSERQLIEGYPNIIFIDGTDVAGDPKVHQEFFDNIWLTEETNLCSCVCLFHYYHEISGKITQYTEIFENKHAKHPINSKLFKIDKQKNKTACAKRFPPFRIPDQVRDDRLRDYWHPFPPPLIPAQAGIQLRKNAGRSPSYFSLTRYRLPSV